MYTVSASRSYLLGVVLLVVTKEGIYVLVCMYVCSYSLASVLKINRVCYLVCVGANVWTWKVIT